MMSWSRPGVQHRLRELPSRVGVYFLLALGLLPRLGYARLWDKLTAGLVGLPVPAPSERLCVTYAADPDRRR